jgi:hypothetical protein
MSNVHLIKDESLGGVLREFYEVEGRPNVGDYVHISNFNQKEVDHIAKVTDTDYDINQFDFIPKVTEDSSPIFDYDFGEECVTLEPTDIVQVGGTRYRLVDREAIVGEKVLITSNHYSTFGEIFTVSEIDSDDDLMFRETSEHYASHGKYHVLEPVESTADDTASMLDLIANLAHRVTSLESQLRDTQGNVQRQGVEIAEINAWLQSPSPWAEQSDVIEINKSIKSLAEQTESNTQDIAMLDERTMPDIKAFKMSDLNGKTLRIYSSSDSENGITVTTTVGIDDASGKMYVLESELKGQ